MKVLLTGASGFVGRSLQRRLEGAGHQVAVVSRTPGAGYDWSEKSLAAGVAASEAVIHLAGENLFARRWSIRQKGILVTSRVETTERLAKLVAERRPAAFLTASAIGWYGASEQRGLDESAPFATDFLGRLAERWEGETRRARQAGVRVATVRIGVVLGQGGGALAKMLPPFRLGLGGPLGSGRQWVSWVHLDDLVSLFLFLLEQPSCAGVYNGTAPNPVTMKELARTLGRVLRRPAFFPMPGLVLRAALGEVAKLLLTGQHVLPKRALAAGFPFRFPELEPALRDLLGKR